MYHFEYAIFKNKSAVEKSIYAKKYQAKREHAQYQVH